MNWRKLNRELHREIGYFSVGLILIYSISGIALNHLHHWNPDLKVKEENGVLNIDNDLTNPDEKTIELALSQLDISYPVKRFYLDRREQLKIFLDVGRGGTGSVTIDPNDKSYNVSILKERKILREFNLLHRNNFKEIWTWVSDLFAIGLIVLAISGLFILKGKYGLKRHGVWLVVAGIALPVIIILIYI